MAKKPAPSKGSPKTPSKETALVRELVDILDDAGLVELEYATGEVEIRLSRAAGGIPAAAMAPQAPAPAPAAAETSSAGVAPAADHPGAVKAPMVGTAYLAPEPGASDFIKTGDSVKSGQTLLIIEAMKVMNPITAPSSGVVKSILVSNGQPVEYGEALVVIE
jgi:acetyl-CoA carboxylase biotin carboxyl carrier protein